MRANVVFLAIGLFVADSALAGPCKLRNSTSGEVTVASAVTSETATTVLETSTDVLIDATTTDTTDVISATATVIDTTTVAFETETSVIAEINPEADTTTAGTTIAVETTTTAAEPAMTTYSLTVRGGPIADAAVQGIGEQAGILLFNPELPGFYPGSYVIEPITGRLQDTETGIFVCAYYGGSRGLETPAMVSNYGYNGQIGTNMLYAYLNCEIVDGLLSCTTPRTTCIQGNRGAVTCSTAGNTVYGTFFSKYSPLDGDFWYIGSGSPSSYIFLDIAATGL